MMHSLEVGPCRLLEGVVSTTDTDGAVNIAPMGPIVDKTMSSLRLRPFRTSTTFANLAATRCGVLHVTDDVLMIARAVTNQLDPLPTTVPAEVVCGHVMTSACRWYEFQVESIDDTSERTECRARVVHQGRLRDFFGFNRAMHAVLEAAILATRTHLLDRQLLLDELHRLRSPLEKTAGADELQAFELLERYVSQACETGSCRQ